MNLQGSNISLRLPRLDDVPARNAWFNDPEFTRLYLGRPSGTPYAQVEEEVRFAMLPSASSGLLEYAVETTSEPRYIGNVFFRKISWQDRSAEIGVFIGPRDLWGKKLGSEALHLMVAYGFRELGFHRIWLTTPSFNQRAIRCFERAGFRREGLFREAIFSGGAFNDVVWMSMLESEFCG